MFVYLLGFVSVIVVFGVFSRFSGESQVAGDASSGEDDSMVGDAFCFSRVGGAQFYDEGERLIEVFEDDSYDFADAF